MVYGAISGAVGGFITGYAISEIIKGAAMGAGIGFFTEAVAGAVTPLSIKRVVAAAAGFILVTMEQTSSGARYV